MLPRLLSATRGTVTASHALQSNLAPGLALLTISLFGSSCADSRTEQTTPKTEVRLARPQAGLLATALAESYERTVRTLSVRIVQASDPLAAIQHDQADLTVTVAPLAYFAHRRYSDAASSEGHLRSVAALSVLPVHLVVREGLPVRDVADLRGHSLMSFFDDDITTFLLDAVGLTGHVKTVNMPSADERQQLALDGNAFDAFLRLTYYQNAFVEAALQRGGRLLNIEGPAIDILQRAYPFIRLATIPAETYSGQEDVIHTIGVKMVLVCRRDLGEQLVHDLTRGFFEALPELAEDIEVLRFVNIDEASSVPIPLHEGAARYYLELGTDVSAYPAF